MAGARALGYSRPVMSETSYTTIAGYYDEVFPPRPGPRRLVLDLLGERAPDATVVDVGCATGGLLRGLTDHIGAGIGVDADPELLRVARGHDHDLSLEFVRGDMAHPDDSPALKVVEADAITCFGNTLVHLTDEADLLAFLEWAEAHLAPGGFLAVQIVHYDRLLREGSTTLPPIDTPRVHFERALDFDARPGLVEFRTELTVKDTGHRRVNSTFLRPLRARELVDLLHRAGFTRVDRHGSFDRDPLEDDSPAVVADARR